MKTHNYIIIFAMQAFQSINFPCILVRSKDFPFLFHFSYAVNNVIRCTLSTSLHSCFRAGPFVRRRDAPCYAGENFAERRSDSGINLLHFPREIPTTMMPTSRHRQALASNRERRINDNNNPPSPSFAVHRDIAEMITSFRERKKEKEENIHHIMILRESLTHINKSAESLGKR